MTKENADGTKSRPLYSLGTTDRALGRRKLARIVAAIAEGRDVLDAVDIANAPERVTDYADACVRIRRHGATFLSRCSVKQVPEKGVEPLT